MRGGQHDPEHPCLTTQTCAAFTHAACLLMSCVNVEARGVTRVLQRRTAAAGACVAPVIRGDTIYILPTPAAGEQGGLHGARGTS